jgi:hypothetical protein
MKEYRFLLLLITFVGCFPVYGATTGNKIDLTLIPPSVITNKVNLDIRAGIYNNDDKSKQLEVLFYLNNEDAHSLLYQTKTTVKANSSQGVQFVMQTADKVGNNKIILVVKGDNKRQTVEKEIQIIDSKIRSTQQINGAWVGLYHWSESEGKMWNKDIKKMTDDQWKELVRSMHNIKMDIIVIQESFRNEMYVDKHHIEQHGYDGKAFYPSKLYPDRMPISTTDPIEDILSEADLLKMNVFVPVGMYAWFDFTPASLNWHKKVAVELWERYGHHPSFYGWYISEENSGGLDAYSDNIDILNHRQKDVVDFFKGFKEFCTAMTPGKPVMLATSSYDVLKGEKIYPELLKNLDIICPFGFARMPEGDLTGEEAAKKMQELCNDSHAHLWFDLEAFLFHAEGYLYPRPIGEIIHDLTLFDNFEETLCYQYPGVFNNPGMSIRIGEESTIKLYLDYLNYIKSKSVGKD